MSVVNLPQNLDEMDKLINAQADSMLHRLQRTYSEFIRSRGTRNGTPPQVYVGAMTGTHKMAAVATAATIEMFQAQGDAVNWTAEEAIAESLALIEKEIRNALRVAKEPPSTEDT